MDRLANYLESLTGSWRALTAPRDGARVETGPAYVACRHPRAVLNNAVLLDASALTTVETIFERVDEYAVWTLDEDRRTAASLADEGYRRDVTTRPMVCRLDELEDPPAGADAPAIRLDADPDQVAALNGVPADLLRGVPGLRAVTTADGRSGLVLITVGADVNVSFVATDPVARRRGLASAVTRAALRDARKRDSATATLQATPVAEAMYAAIGFRPVGRWQEWIKDPSRA